MKIYVVIDLNGDYTNVFTTKKAAEKYYKSDKESPLKPPEKFEIPISKEGILPAIRLGANWGGNEVGVDRGWQYVTKQLKCFLLINKGDRDEKN